MSREGGLRILVIDDDPEIIGVVRMMVELDDHEAIEATEGEEGLRLAREEEPDVILLDVMMTHLDGYEVFRLLQEDDRTSGIPVIFVSGKASHRDVEKGLSLGAYGYVTKPFHPSSLMKLIHKAVEESNPS